MGDAGATDDVGFALDVGEMQEAAEVVILVENVKSAWISVGLS